MSTLPLPTAIGASAGTEESVLRISALQRLRSKITGRFGYALADQVVYSFGNMVVAALVSRHCGQRQFGIYILTQRAMDVLIQLCNVFLWAPFSFNLAGTPADQRASYQGSMLQLQILACLLLTGVLTLAAYCCRTNVQSDLHYVFVPLIATGGGILFREFTRRMYFAQMRLREAFWTEVATVALQIAGMEWLLLNGRLSVATTLAVLCGGAVLVSLWWFATDAARLRFRVSAAWADLQLNLRLGRWFLGSNMIFTASSQCNPWILGVVLGGGSVGAYAVCESLVNIPRVALTSMQNVMGPATATAYAEGGPRLVARTVSRFDRFLCIGSLVFAVCIWLMGPSVARLVFHNVPSHSELLLGVLACNLVVYASTLAQSYGLTALGRADTTLFANALGLAVQALLCFFFVRWWAATGAASAMLVGSVVVLGARHLFYRRQLSCAGTASASPCRP